MLQLFLIATFVYVLFLVSYTNIKAGLKGSYYRENEYFPKRYLMQLVFWIGIVLNYLTPPLHQMNFQGNLLSVLFDIAFWYSSVSIGIFILCALNKRRIRPKMEEQKKDSNAYFYSDNPVINNKDDRLNREKFVDHVINSLNKINGENLTIGFYGKWGTGKTSIFKMIKEKIEVGNNKNDYLIFEFKPWYFGKEDYEIIIEFLEQLLNEIRKSNGFDPKIEKNIIKYLNALSSVSLRLPGITINFKETHSLIEELFSKKNQSIKDIKEAIEKSLENSNKKIVVFIDDIDRLNKEEIQTIFRLVRLICDFPNITYIVALDEEIVASALAELHGKDENADAKKIGREYLEKFIQIPLYIPETDVYGLNQMLWNGVREILNENHLLEESVFLSIEFSSTRRLIGLQKIGFSPRNIIRYLNVVKVMLPLLKEDIYVDDLLYLMFIKVGSPNLYEKIILNSEVFLNSNSTDDKVREKIRKEYVGYEKILMRLFPNFISTSKVEIDHTAIEMRNRICSKDYFKRYFMYDVPESEKILSKFFKELKVQPLENLSSQFEHFLSLYSIEKVFSVVEYNLDKFNEIQYKNVIEILCILLIKEQRKKFSYHEEEYVRLIAILSIYLGGNEKNPIFNRGLDIWLLPRINKILNRYISGINEISKINQVPVTKVQYLIDDLKDSIRDYMEVNNSTVIFNKYSFKDNGEFFLLWNNIEDTEKKRKTIGQWIQKKDDLEILIPLIFYPISGEASNVIERYTRIVELLDIKKMNNYLDFENDSEEEYPNLVKLRSIVENIEIYLFNALDWVIRKENLRKDDLSFTLGNVDYEESIFMNNIEETLKCLIKYGDEQLQDKIQKYVLELKRRNIMNS